MANSTSAAKILTRYRISAQQSPLTHAVLSILASDPPASLAQSINPVVDVQTYITGLLGQANPAVREIMTTLAPIHTKYAEGA